MKRRGWHMTVLIIAALLLLVVLLLLAFTILPSVSNAPTTQGPGSVSLAAASLQDIIAVTAPLPHSTVASPLTISGEALGSWYYEATAPVELKDASGVVIAHGTIRAQKDWKSPGSVPFIGVLTFAPPVTKTGTVVLQNDNPSGDPSKQKELDIPVQF